MKRNGDNTPKRTGRIFITRLIYFFGGLIGAVAMGIGCVFVFDVITQADCFTAARIDISGNQRLSEAAIWKQARVVPGVNVFSVNLFQARKRLLAHPWVASAEVTRQIPNRLKIRINEHQPLALIDLGRTFIINTDGRIFKEKSPSDRVTAPMIEGLTYSDIRLPGDPERLPFSAVMAVLRLGQKPGSVLADRKVKIIRVDRQTGLTLYAFGESAAIKLGYNDFAEKFRRLDRVLAFCRKEKSFRHLRVIDLNDVNRIVVYPLRAESDADDKKEA